MKFFVAFLILALAAARRSPAELRQQWSDWKAEHGKFYPHNEEPLRFRNFARNAEQIDRMNAARQLPEDAIYNFTKFSDLTKDEFKSMYLMDERTYRQNRLSSKANGIKAEVSDAAPPASWDWRTKGVVSPVKNQGQCGSCWDFSATETTESVCAIAGYPLTLLSEQQVLQCDQQDYGCNGGFPWTAYEYVISAGGYDTEKNYPYTAEGGPSSDDCQFKKNAVYECKPKSWKYVEQNQNEQTMQTFMAANSPLSICVDAETWMNYQSGVVKAQGCGRSIDHCVQAVGWEKVGNTEACWGTDWGMQGYLYVQLGANACGIAEDVSVPCVAAKSGGATVC